MLNKMIWKMAFRSSRSSMILVSLFANGYILNIRRKNY